MYMFVYNTHTQTQISNNYCVVLKTCKALFELVRKDRNMAILEGGYS